MNVQVNGNSKWVELRPTITTSAYDAGDNIGGKLTLSNALRSGQLSGVLQNLVIVDESNQKAGFNLFLFNADPTAATLTDNAAAALSTDVTKLIARIEVTSSDYVTVNGVAVADLDGRGRVLVSEAKGTLYGAIVAVDTPTYAGTDDLLVRLGFLQD